MRFFDMITEADLVPRVRLGEFPPLPPWEARPRRLVSLLEMLEFNATAFYQLSNVLMGLETTLLSARDIDEEAEDLSESQEVARRTTLFVLHNIDEIRGHLKALWLDAAVAQIDRIKAYYAGDLLTIENLYPLVKELRLRISDQLQARLFLFVSFDKDKYFNGKALFGGDVETKFPATTYDIAEAGKCLALERSTATVCHLMRVMEVGVQALATKLSPSINVDKAWGKILEKVDAEIDKLPSGDAKDDLRGVAASLHAVKDAWRNPTMHPRATHTEEEAEEIFTACKTFMRRLAQIV